MSANRYPLPSARFSAFCLRTTLCCHSETNWVFGLVRFLRRHRQSVGRLCLGTSYLPALFVASLVVTAVAAPLVSAFLSRPGQPKPRLLSQLFLFIAGVLLCFYLVFWLVHDTDSAEVSFESSQQATNERPLPIPASDRSDLAVAQRSTFVAFYLWVIQSLAMIVWNWPAKRRSVSKTSSAFLPSGHGAPSSSPTHLPNGCSVSSGLDPHLVRSAVRLLRNTYCTRDVRSSLPLSEWTV